MELWLKALHVIAVISWMAGLLYLPRLFIYHVEAKPGSQLALTLQVMERRLLKIIMMPAMLITWITGLWLAYRYQYFDDLWFQLKFIAVVGLTIFHVMAAKWRVALAHDHNKHSARFYRIANEVPTVLMIAIVIFVIVKPF